MAYVNQAMQGEINQPPETPTWVTHYLLPLAQNLTGGAAVSVFVFLGVIAYTGLANPLIDLYNAGVWCSLAGGAVACILTIIRFFGDELGLLQAAYNAGYNAREPEVSALHMELHTLRTDMTVEQAEGSARSAISKRQQQDAKQLESANKLISVFFSGGVISREAMDKNSRMGRADWDAGIRLLKAAGVADANNNIVATNAGVAMRAVKEVMDADRARGDKFVPKWQ